MTRVPTAAASAPRASTAAASDDFATLTEQSAHANAALVRGDINGYLALMDHASDYTLMSPFGGMPTCDFDTSSEYRAALARFFKLGTFAQQVPN